MSTAPDTSARRVSNTRLMPVLILSIVLAGCSSSAPASTSADSTAPAAEVASATAEAEPTAPVAPPDDPTTAEADAGAAADGDASLVLFGRAFANPHEFAPAVCSTDVNGLTTYVMTTDADVIVQVTLVPIDDVATGVDLAVERDGEKFLVTSFDDTQYGDSLGPLAGSSTVHPTDGDSVDPIDVDWSFTVASLSECAADVPIINPSPGVGLDDGTGDDPQAATASATAMTIDGAAYAFVSGCFLDGEEAGTLSLAFDDPFGERVDVEFRYLYDTGDTDMLVLDANDSLLFAGMAPGDELTFYGGDGDSGVFGGLTTIFGPTGSPFELTVDVDLGTLPDC